MVILENCDQLSRQGKRHYPVDLNILLMIAVYAGTTCITIHAIDLLYFRDDLFLTAVYFLSSNFFSFLRSNIEIARTLVLLKMAHKWNRVVVDKATKLIFDDYLIKYFIVSSFISKFILLYIFFYFVRININLYVLTVSCNIAVNFVRGRAEKYVSRKQTK